MTGHPHAIVDVSHRSDAFALSGSSCEYLLNHGCPLDLSIDAFPVGMCTRTVFAKAAILLSQAGAGDLSHRRLALVRPLCLAIAG